MQYKAEYYSGLIGVTENGDWEEWILYMLEGIEQTAADTKQRILAIRSELEVAIELARSEMRKGYSKELIELVFQQPYTRISNLEKANIAKRETASLYLRELERIGMLSGVKLGRQVLYINHRLLEILAN